MKTRAAIVVSMLAVAAMVGIVITLADELIFATAVGRSIRFEEVDVLAMNAVLTSIPFVALAFFKPRRLPWLVAIAATVALHGWWLAKGISYQMAPDGTGVPILGAILMLFSPFAILLVVGILNGVMSRRETTASHA